MIGRQSFNLTVAFLICRVYIIYLLSGADSAEIISLSFVSRDHTDKRRKRRKEKEKRKGKR